MVSGKVPSGPGVGVSVTEGGRLVRRGRSAVPGRVGHRERGGDRDGEHHRGHGAGDRVAAALDPAGPGADVVEAERVAAHVLGAVAQLARQQVSLVEVVHRSSSPSRASIGCVCTRCRIDASARLACDFTVPTEMPRMSATSASVRSS